MICETCDGSGEGMYPGTNCRECHGLGEVPGREPEDEWENDE